MELTSDNLAFCMRLVRPFGMMKRVPPEKRFEEAMDYLAETLMKACSRRDIAEEIAALVIENEEDFPAPGTLRKYLRDRNYVEQDVEARRDERNRREIAAQRKVLGG